MMSAGHCCISDKRRGRATKRDCSEGVVLKSIQDAEMGLAEPRHRGRKNKSHAAFSCIFCIWSYEDDPQCLAFHVGTAILSLL